MHPQQAKMPRPSQFNEKASEATPLLLPLSSCATITVSTTRTLLDCTLTDLFLVLDTLLWFLFSSFTAQALRSCLIRLPPPESDPPPTPGRGMEEPSDMPVVTFYYIAVGALVVQGLLICIRCALPSVLHLSPPVSHSVGNIGGHCYISLAKNITSSYIYWKVTICYWFARQFALSGQVFHLLYVGQDVLDGPWLPTSKYTWASYTVVWLVYTALLWTYIVVLFTYLERVRVSEDETRVGWVRGRFSHKTAQEKMICLSA
ncbi:hypothetical protein BJ508DRAFT_337230 [Ascobolus immersus RN42]|uniref:Uncharacterized protein n=1 Tax=Ascobolus immersus RN42 TaxID=1160509 RepID=A0A3N4IT93_ASCIM|nr:hypothetical protein BJ508DRAFT_337230 [Ascobolus immersus RN42]